MPEPVEIRPMPVRDLARCVFLLALIFALASLAGCKSPEAAYVAADAQTLKALERPLAERIALERERGDGEQAWIWENVLESWRERVKDAQGPEVKAPSQPPKPVPPHDGPVPVTSSPRPE
jgi:hypothetical protein